MGQYLLSTCDASYKKKNNVLNALFDDFVLLFSTPFILV